MSRLGRKPIAIPKGVTVTAASGQVAVKGPKGELKRVLPAGIDVKVDGGTVHVLRESDSREHRSLHGLSRALVANMVAGVTDGFERKLEINGVGYKVDIAGQTLTFALGFSHPIEYVLPKSITPKLDKNVLTLTSIDREAVGDAAAKIRGFRPPEPYKGKGVKYLEEKVRRKVGKTGAS